MIVNYRKENDFNCKILIKQMDISISKFIVKHGTDELVNSHLINLVETTELFMKFWFNFNQPLINHRLIFFSSCLIHLVNILCGCSVRENIVPAYFICSFVDPHRFSKIYANLKGYQPFLKQKKSAAESWKFLCTKFFNSFDIEEINQKYRDEIIIFLQIFKDEIALFSVHNHKLKK